MRNLLFAVAVAAALVIAGLGLAGSESGPNVAAAPHSAPGQRIVGAGYLTPSSINTTCQQDGTVGLVRWLYSLPQGTPTAPTVVQFRPNGCYEMNGSMFLRDFRY